MREDVMLTKVLFVTSQEKSVLFLYLPKVQPKLDPVCYLTTCVALLTRCSYSAATFGGNYVAGNYRLGRTHWSFKKKIKQSN